MNVIFNNPDEKINYLIALERIEKYLNYDSEINFFVSIGRLDIIDQLKKYEELNKNTFSYAFHNLRKQLRLTAKFIFKFKG